MKIFKLMAIALVAMLGFSACEKDCDHDFIEVDHSKDLVGTWTCLTADYAEALVIKADGSAVSTGYDGTEYWENVAGNIVVENGTITMTFEDGDNFKGHFDIVPGVAFSIYTDEGAHLTFYYCKEDLADEIVGMWVCHEGLPGVENDMAIKTYSEDGKYTLTTQASSFIDKDVVMAPGDYKIVGDLLFMSVAPQCLAARLTYTPNETTLGDIMTETLYAPSENGDVYLTSTWLRVKQSLDLAGKKYDYIKTFVTNVDGLDQDIDFMGYTFNFAKMDGTTIDQMLKALLFSVEFPSANKIKYSCRFSSGVQTVEAPIAVDGNKMTLKMSELYPTAKDVDLYTFQDADCSQMHMYMPTYAFINFFGNMQVIMMSQLGQLDTNNAEAVKAVFDTIDAAVNTINVSFVMTKAAK